MLTVGFLKELYFIAKVQNREQNIIFTNLLYILNIRISPQGLLNIFYQENLIWQENLEGEDSFFGVESCDTISRIIACIDNGDSGWRERYIIKV